MKWLGINRESDERNCGKPSESQLQQWDKELCQEEGFSSFPAAWEALKKFGGFRYSGDGPGAEVAREPFVIDPLTCSGEMDRFKDFEQELGVRLFPLGESSGGRAFLAIDETGRVFELETEIRLVGLGIAEAVENLVAGRLPESSG